MIFVADFETINESEDCRVWAWACADISSPDEVTVDNNLDSFINHISRVNGSCYFHNLKFDGSFIIYWLFKHGYEHVERKRGYSGKLEKLEPGQMHAVIGDMGQWYSLTVCWKNSQNTTQFLDSAKLIMLPVSKIPKAFGLEESKLTIDYKEHREVGHKLTAQEIAYVKADVIIVAKAMAIMRQQGLTKVTIASNALADYKNRIGKSRFQNTIPKD